jgi:hypothetical protein
MRLAYADPPYLGCCLKYGHRHDLYGCWDVPDAHAHLVKNLVKDFPDGWALSTSAKGLPTYLAACPPAARTAIWHVTNSPHPGNMGRWWWAWEAVIVWGGRREVPVVRNVFTGHAPSGYFGNEITGQKTEGFCRWVLNLLGYLDGDELVDLYPGSGVMGRVLTQGRLSV